ncbi:MAG: hypothetical protein CO113_04655 [Elusimicrobia bacterium CG_4_9_14_3_um_filter_62_55]|nr:MAG: hypothetical protein COR54_08120 [Elusimicrobia bacterium CG22_combo_CG10-13_8_21_14_all_63_91]PJA14038.1 MAG: hypothetical protein COX66_13580 [Elusimicrobia bacterium CG_4_10_14_0_2_um_filter_63_34]PJB26249.1 MAG: hypothetical protein CO113_04655 [Elusimicrobia bacterium CG_4_9_14_3_um_filter_62_55]
MKRILASILAVSLNTTTVLAVPTAFPKLAPALLEEYSAPQIDLIAKTSLSLGLSVSPDGTTFHVGADALGPGRPVGDKVTKRLLTFFSKLPEDDPETGMAMAMRSYLAPRMPADKLFDNRFLKLDANGKPVLTPLGKQALLDILTAQDGQLLEAPPKQMLGAPVIMCGKAEGGFCPVSDPKIGGLNAVGGRTAAELSHAKAAATSPDAAFDGRTHQIGYFDWNQVETAVAKPGGLKSVTGTGGELSGYKVDQKTGMVRVIVAAKHAVDQDVFRVDETNGRENQIYEATMLDAQLFQRHGARIVRAVDNLVTVDLPLASAIELGKTLQETEGVMSRPARVFKSTAKAAADAMAASPAMPLLGAQFLPIPSGLGLETKGRVSPKLVESRSMVDAEGLNARGMTGNGAIFGIIDSGIDIDHPDMKDEKGRSRVVSYMDFTGEGTDDVVGHGTHVAGTIGGNGKESDGKYKGVAPDARFKIAKVFGTEGETDESVILAAMKWMASQQEGTAKADVINMSLGGPGTPNVDPLGSMANTLIAKDNVLVVAAAGNEGPWASTVGSPGNARYVLTVGGVNKEGETPFFSSRGPILGPDGKELYVKPDIVAVSGDVDLSAIEQKTIMVENAAEKDPAGRLASIKAEPTNGKCVYGPGVIAPRSGKDPDEACALSGNKAYRKMSGTSMAAPQVTGGAGSLIGYLKEQGVDYDAFQVRAALMETAKDLGKTKEQQGSGLMQGGNVAAAVIDRVKLGIPVGNIAFALSMRLTTKDVEKVKAQRRYELTEIGLLDTQTGRIINTEDGLVRALEEIRATKPMTLVRELEPTGVEPLIQMAKERSELEPTPPPETTMAG